MIGSMIGAYRIEGKLGHGGMGEVYLALDPKIRRHVAIKLLRSQFVGNADLVARFRSEALAVNLVRHPCIVQIYDFGQTEDGSHYLVMEYLIGETLADRLKKNPTQLSETEAGWLGVQLASALGAAHSHGIVHRDLKPSNIMLVPDPIVPDGKRVRLLDFGIAKLAHGIADFTKPPTETGQILGTPLYMSPEQCMGSSDIDGKADVYSLGIVLYRILAGRLPFTSPSPHVLIHNHLRDQPPNLKILIPSLDPALVRLVHRMLEKDRNNRPSMIVVERELRRLRIEGTAAKPTSGIEEVLIHAVLGSAGGGQHTATKPASALVNSPGDQNPLGNLPAAIQQNSDNLRAEAAAPRAVSGKPTVLMSRPTVPMRKVRVSPSSIQQPPALPGTKQPADSIVAQNSLITERSTLSLRKRHLLIASSLAATFLSLSGLGIWRYEAVAKRAIQEQVAVSKGKVNQEEIAASDSGTVEKRTLSRTAVNIEQSIPDSLANSSKSAEEKPDCANIEGIGYKKKNEGKFEESFNIFSESYKKCNNQWMIVEKGRAKQSLGQYEEALLFYGDFLGRNPTHFRKGMIEERIVCAKKAKSAVEKKNLSLQSDDEIDKKSAQEALINAYDLCNDPILLLDIADLCYRNSEYKNVIEKCDQVLHSHPEGSFRERATNLKERAEAELQKLPIVPDLGSQGLKSPF